MMQPVDVILLTVAPGIGVTLGEKIFIGVITSLTLTIILSFIRFRKERKQQLQDKIVQKEIHAAEYLQTLKLIALESNEHYEFNAERTVEELLNLCNPKNFMNPYQPKNVDIANQLYTKLLNVKKHNNIYYPLLDIWGDAEEQLNVHLSSDAIYDILCHIYNPQRFIDKNYNPSKLKASNRAYQYICENKQNRLVLENFAREVGVLQFDNSLNGLIHITTNGDMIFGDIVFVCDKYPILFHSIEDGCYILYQINDNVEYKESLYLKKFLKEDSLGRNFLQIPIEECEIIVQQ